MLQVGKQNSITKNKQLLKAA